MSGFLRQLWGFVRPYRGRFLLGLLCGVGYGLVNGLLIAAVNQVVKLVFEGDQQLEKAPHWIQPLTHRLAMIVPEIHAPAANDTLGWVLVIGTIPVIMLARNTLQYLGIYLTNWSAMHAIADIRTKLFSHLQNGRIWTQSLTGSGLGSGTGILPVNCVRVAWLAETHRQDACATTLPADAGTVSSRT